MGSNIHIFYRHVHSKAESVSRDPNKRRPEWFSYESCFRNLLATIRQDPLAHRVRLTVVFDGGGDEFQDDFISGYYANSALGINLQFIKAGSDLDSFLITLWKARTEDMNGKDVVYFLENDYLHQYGWVSKVFEVYDSGIKFDYISLYDHPDKYMLPMYEGLSAKLYISPSHHWRTAPSSCASFIVSRDILEQDYDVLGSGITDYYFFGRLVSERSRVLITPIPGLSTHCMAGYLSPNVDWVKCLC
jgi:hypothetical protein